MTRPKAVLDATERYFEDQDLVGQWLDDWCEVRAGALGKPKDLSGLAVGDGPVSIALGVLIVACVAVMTRQADPSEARTS